MSDETRTIELNVYHDGRGQIQVAIESVSPDGCVSGFRLIGPKFDGSGVLHRRRVLSVSDARTIRRYLDQIEVAGADGGDAA